MFLCKQITLDFNEEELCSIQKDSEGIKTLIAELQEFMPQSEAHTGKSSYFMVFLVIFATIFILYYITTESVV